MEPHQERLWSLLQRHRPEDATERAHQVTIQTFVATRSDCFERRALPGHVTGSAFVVDPQRRRLLLHHHRKLDRWLQMGGHDDGERDAQLTALREAREETGLASLELALDEMLDVDVHAIPSRPAEPAHDHLDVRFLISADSTEPLHPDASESLALAWFDVQDAAVRMSEPGATRVVAKIQRWLRAGSPG